MAIRLRRVKGVLVALCAAETDPVRGDVYLDDSVHHALSAKYAQDWQGEMIDWSYPEEWAAMETQTRRDAQEELRKWIEAGSPEPSWWAKIRWHIRDVYAHGIRAALARL